MADHTKISWADATWNVITGCSVHSAGCTNCYAMRLAGTRLKHDPSRIGLTRRSKAGPVWTGEVRFNEKWLLQPFRWKRPRTIFVCAHADLFHEDVPDEWIDRVFAVMALCPQHTFQVLTKRSVRMQAYCTSRFESEHGIMMLEDAICAIDGFGSDAGGDPYQPFPNVWLGVSVEDQRAAEKRIPDLLFTPAAVRWISAEPLLGPVNLTRLSIPVNGHLSALTGNWSSWPIRHTRDGAVLCMMKDTAKLDWVVCGGESGPDARPMHPDWARSLRDQCAAAGVMFHFKQWGNYAPGEVAGEYLDPCKAARGKTYFDGRWIDDWSAVDGHCDDEPDVYRIGKKKAGRLLDGVLHDAIPEPRS
jgi:protein gp37